MKRTSEVVLELLESLQFGFPRALHLKSTVWLVLHYLSHGILHPHFHNESRYIKTNTYAGPIFKIKFWSFTCYCLITVWPIAGEWKMPHISRNNHFNQMTFVTYWCWGSRTIWMGNQSLPDKVNLKQYHNYLLYPFSQDTISQLLGLLGDECSCNKLSSLHGTYTAEDILFHLTWQLTVTLLRVF